MSRGLGLIAYGTEGIGKTEWSLQFPKPLLCLSISEYGFVDLDEVGRVPNGCENYQVESYEDYKNELRYSDSFSTIVTDTVSGLTHLWKQYIKDKHYKEDLDPEKSFNSFQEGWLRFGPTVVQELTSHYEQLRSKGVNIIVLGHDKRKTIKNPLGEDFQSTVLNIEDGPSEELRRWAQATLFMTMDYTTKVTKVWKGQPTESKVQGGIDADIGRYIYTSKHPTHSAKNRLGIKKNFISMGDSAAEAYKNFVNELTVTHQEHLTQG